MQLNINKEKLHHVQNSWYQWRNNADTITMIMVSFLFACFTGLMAQVTLAIPWTPVLITMQTFAVLLAGVLLGGKWGGFSMILYTILGIAGMPWFTNMNHGLAFMFEASGGYIVGFIIAAAVIGYVFDHYASSRSPIGSMMTLLVANFVCIYIPGLVGLYTTMLNTGRVLSLPELLFMGVVPFVVGDLFKILVVSGISTSILPKDE